MVFLLKITTGISSSYCLQCFDNVGWASEEHSACKKLSDEMLARLSRVRCKWCAYGPADATATVSSLASLKSSAGLPRLWWKRGH